MYKFVRFATLLIYCVDWWWGWNYWIGNNVPVKAWSDFWRGPTSSLSLCSTKGGLKGGVTIFTLLFSSLYFDRHTIISLHSLFAVTISHDGLVGHPVHALFYQEPADTSKQNLGHVTGYQRIWDQYWSVPAVLILLTISLSGSVAEVRVWRLRSISSPSRKSLTTILAAFPAIL